jgi:hypothetical protein
MKPQPTLEEYGPSFSDLWARERAATTETAACTGCSVAPGTPAGLASSKIGATSKLMQTGWSLARPDLYGNTWSSQTQTVHDWKPASKRVGVSALAVACLALSPHERQLQPTGGGSALTQLTKLNPGPSNPPSCRRPYAAAHRNSQSQTMARTFGEHVGVCGPFRRQLPGTCCPQLPAPHAPHAAGPATPSTSSRTCCNGRGRA